MTTDVPLRERVQLPSSHDSVVGNAFGDAAWPPPVLDRARPAAAGLSAEAFVAVVRASGLGPAALARSFAGLAFGRGGIAFSDFVRLRLFDREVRAAGDLARYVGQRRNRDLCVTANFRHDWHGLMSDKVAGLSYLAAHGYPTIPIRAICAPGLSGAAGHVLADRGALEAFLLDPAQYPLFGKPVDGVQSLGSIALAGCTPARRTLERPDGTGVPLDAFVDAIHEGYRDGYLFQPWVAPDPAIAALCGQRLATVRVLTLSDGSGPRVFRAAWKIPAGGNVADNYWRDGNLLGQIDLDTGRLQRVVSGTGLGLRVHDHHPDTGTPLAGFRHPHWEAVRTLAVEGARLMRHVPLIGWDIAGTAQGPVIVEMNETPDFFLVQLADRRGVLGPDFDAFLAEKRASASAHRRGMHRLIARL